MVSALRARLTYSNVVATLALFFALAGTASAAIIISSNDQVAPDTISGHNPPSGDHSNLISGSVNSQDLTDDGITSADIANGQVMNPDIASNAIGGGKISDGGVQTADLANNAVVSGKIADGGVQTADLATNSVTSAKIADGGVQNADLASSSVNTFKITDGQVLNADLGFGAVDSSKVADSSLTGGDVLNRGLSDSDIGSPAQVNSADLPAVGAHSCIALSLNFGGWTQVGELVIATARDGRLATSGLFITPLVVTTSGTASGRICNLSDATIDAAPEDILAWSLRQ